MFIFIEIKSNHLTTVFYETDNCEQQVSLLFITAVNVTTASRLPTT